MVDVAGALSRDVHVQAAPSPRVAVAEPTFVGIEDVGTLWGSPELVLASLDSDAVLWSGAVLDDD